MREPAELTDERLRAWAASNEYPEDPDETCAALAAEVLALRQQLHKEQCHKHAFKAACFRAKARGRAEGLEEAARICDPGRDGPVPLRTNGPFWAKCIREAAARAAQQSGDA